MFPHFSTKDPISLPCISHLFLTFLLVQPLPESFPSELDHLHQIHPKSNPPFYRHPFLLLLSLPSGFLQKSNQQSHALQPLWQHTTRKNGHKKGEESRKKAENTRLVPWRIEPYRESSREWAELGKVNHKTRSHTMVEKRTLPREFGANRKSS